MAEFPSETLESCQRLLERLEGSPHDDVWLNVLKAMVGIGRLDLSRLDVKILAATLRDMEMGYQAFLSYQHVRKISIFGSARLPADSPEYLQAAAFARCIVAQGFMVLTGGGGGIMEAGNEGAGLDNSFGLNIQLPFEQEANAVLAASDRVVNFKYFFTRKLFFLKESDAVVLFPGGFGTQDEGFECLTLMQTGKTPLMPLVLVDRPGGHYWKHWDTYIQTNLLSRGLISPEDIKIYTMTDDIGVACDTIANFYRTFHSSRFVGDRLVLRLNAELTDDSVARLNDEFCDILLSGRIAKSDTLPPEKGDETEHLPRLMFHFNQRNFGRLWQLVRRINQLECVAHRVNLHPERK
ncbi:MAG: LOG family protein [Cyanobacteria bacterium P01_F01_bin.33]